MAPIRGPDKKAVLEQLRSLRWLTKLPIRLAAQGSPAGVILHEEGLLRLCKLKLNHTAAEAEHRRQVQAGDYNWMPENTWRFLEPDRILIEESDRERFIARLEELTPWPFGSEDHAAEEAARRDRDREEQGRRSALEKAENAEAQSRGRIVVDFVRQAESGELDEVTVVALLDHWDRLDSSMRRQGLTAIGRMDPHHDDLLPLIARHLIHLNPLVAPAARVCAVASAIEDERDLVRSYINLLQRHERTPSPSADWLLQQGIRLFQAGDHDRSLPYFDVAVQFETGLPEGDLWLLHALTYLWNERHRYGDSVAWIERFLATGGEIPASAAMNVSNAYIGVEKFTEAERICLQALEGSRDGSVHHGLAVVYALTGRPDQALDQIKAARDAGYPGYAGMANDPQLASLRKRPAFTRLFSDDR